MSWEPVWAEAPPCGQHGPNHSSRIACTVFPVSSDLCPAAGDRAELYSSAVLCFRSHTQLCCTHNILQGTIILSITRPTPGSLYWTPECPISVCCANHWSRRLPSRPPFSVKCFLTTERLQLDVLITECSLCVYWGGKGLLYVCAFEYVIIPLWDLK